MSTITVDTNLLRIVHAEGQRTILSKDAMPRDEGEIAGVRFAVSVGSLMTGNFLDALDVEAAAVWLLGWLEDYKDDNGIPRNVHELRAGDGVTVVYCDACGESLSTTADGEAARAFVENFRQQHAGCLDRQA